MKKLKIILSLAGVAAIAVHANAQDTNTDSHTIGITIPVVTLVDIEPAASKNLTMPFTAPTEAGLPLALPAANNTLWLNYSSIKPAVDQLREVTVSVNTVTPGVNINVSAATATGSGDGDLGTPVVGPLTLTDQGQIIIDNIGSAYTGNGMNNGHQLTYTVTTGTGTAYAALVGSNTPVVATVTYTIADK